MPLDFPDSLWKATATPPVPSPVLQGDLDADVTIIGAGFTGLRAALMLAEQGSSVVVVDAGDVGWGASGRNGGQVNPVLPFNSPGDVQKLLGPVYAGRLTDVSLGSADALFNLILRHGIDCGARQNGWLRVDHCDKAGRISRGNAESWNREGAEMQVVIGDDLRAMTGSTAYKTGILTPRGGAVNPLSLARGLAQAARGAGAQIFGDSPVIKLAERAQGGWDVTTAKGRVRSDWVIVATNGYSDDLVPNLAGSILPLVSAQVATEPLEPGLLDEILPGGHTISDTRRVIMYARREPDNRMVFGGHGSLGPDGQVTGHDWVMRDAVRIYPQLKNVAWRYKWGGRIAITEDRLPHLHEPAKGLVIGLGYNGRGVAMSHVMGRVLAERAMGRAPEDLDFPVTDLRPMPFRGLQLMAKGAAIGWMKLRDRVEVVLG